MQYRLRTLLIVLAILPPLLAVGWWKYDEWKAEQDRLRAAEDESIVDVFVISCAIGEEADSQKASPDEN